MVASTVGAAAAGAAAVDVRVSVVRPLAMCVLVAMTAKLVLDASVLTHLRPRSRSVGTKGARRWAPDDLARTAILLRDDLSAATAARSLCGIAGGIVVPVLLLVADDPGSLDVTLALAIVSLGLVVAGELAERWLFFTAEAGPRMPGSA
jgi:hypothetical protein